MQATQAVRDQFAPTGELRVALNHGNRVLVGWDADARPVGISVDLARRLADALSLPLRFVHYERAVDVSNSAGDKLWDVCFLAVDPARAETIDFTDPYLRIEGGYLAGARCPAADAAALIASGARIGTVEGSAYTLTLQRAAGAENLILYRDITASLAALDRGEVSAIAGIGNVMRAEAGTRPGVRVLNPPFTEIRQAMAIVKGRSQAAGWLTCFVKDLARSGEMGEILERHGIPRDCAFDPD